MSGCSSIVQSLVRSPATKWAVGGWSFFIVENLVLSENRSYLISQVGENTYHTMYGTLSTIAMASTAYGYRYHVRNAQPLLWKSSSSSMPPLPSKVAGWLCLSLGFGILSQTVPKLQIPIARIQSHNNTTRKDKSRVEENHTSSITTTETSSQWQVRCPFDFTDSRSQSALPTTTTTTVEMVSGADRISRHPGLFSFGFVSLGYGILSPSLPMQLFFSMPMAVAIIGGAHSDSRHRRGLGGTLPPHIDAQTSLIPFMALLSGKQSQYQQSQGLLEHLQDFWIHDVKKLNLGLAMGLATMILLRKGRPMKNTNPSSSLRNNIVS